MGSHSEWVQDVLLTWDAGRVASLIGPPGIGKTAQAHTAHRLYWGDRADTMPCEVVMASLCDPTDFAGILTVDEKTGETVRLPPAWARRIVKAGGGTVFFDEATLVTPATWKALLRVILDKVVGDLRLPDTVRFLLASNPVEMTADGNLFPPAGANRVSHYTVTAPSPSEWATWMLETATTTGDAHAVHAAQLVGAYVEKFGGTALLNVPKDEEGRAGAWPSPRSCHAAADILAASYRRGDMATEEGTRRMIRAVGATVGTGWAGQFATYLTQNDLPAPRDVLTGVATFAFDRARPDRARPVVTSVALDATKGPAKDKKERAKLVEAAWGVLLAASDAGLADVAAKAAEILNTYRMSSEGGGTASVTPATTPNEIRALKDVYRQFTLAKAKK